jgi:hypothetical protein
MSAIHDVDVDLATFCGRIGNLYGRHGLCPPFALRDAAQGWMARDIPLSHCIDVIERYLGRNARSHYSGSGDRNFAWLSGLIETSWHEHSFARQPDRRRSAWHTTAGFAPRRRAPGGSNGILLVQQTFSGSGSGQSGTARFENVIRVGTRIGTYPGSIAIALGFDCLRGRASADPCRFGAVVRISLPKIGTAPAATAAARDSACATRGYPAA